MQIYKSLFEADGFQVSDKPPTNKPYQTLYIYQDTADDTDSDDDKPLVIPAPKCNPKGAPKIVKKKKMPVVIDDDTDTEDDEPLVLPPKPKISLTPNTPIVLPTDADEATKKLAERVVAKENYELVLDDLLRWFVKPYYLKERETNHFDLYKSEEGAEWLCEKMGDCEMVRRYKDALEKDKKWMLDCLTHWNATAKDLADKDSDEAKYWWKHNEFWGKQWETNSEFGETFKVARALKGKKFKFDDETYYTFHAKEDYDRRRYGVISCQFYWTKHYVKRTYNENPHYYTKFNFVTDEGLEGYNKKYCAHMSSEIPLLQPYKDSFSTFSRYTECVKMTDNGLKKQRVVTKDTGNGSSIFLNTRAFVATDKCGVEVMYVARGKTADGTKRAHNSLTNGLGTAEHLKRNLKANGIKIGKMKKAEMISALMKLN